MPQLHVTPGGKGNAVGDLFKRDTGLDPSDSTNWKATVDYALDHAARNGWGDWSVAKNLGIPKYAGIGMAGPTAPAAGGLLAQGAPQGNPAQPAQQGLLAQSSGDTRPPGSPLMRNGQSALPPGTPINSKGQPYSPGLLNMPADQAANVVASMAAIRQAQQAGQNPYPGSGGAPAGAYWRKPHQDSRRKRLPPLQRLPRPRRVAGP